MPGMRQTPRWLPVLLLAALAAPTALLAGCGQGGSGSTPGASASDTADSAPVSAPTITLTRTGGLAGVNESIEISTDGGWTYTDHRKGTSESGKLTDAQRADLANLALNPDLVTEAQQEPPGKCADAFVYSVNVAGLAVSFEHCESSAKRPVLDAVIELVTSATPM